jgi:phosphoglycerate dehydrogenase-like enzyme
MTNVLIVETHAEAYAAALREKFTGLELQVAQSAADAHVEYDKAEILIAFGMGITDQLFARMPKLKWVQSLATGVDHFLRCPSLKPDVLITSGRGIHGPPMREQVVYLMMAVSRDAKRQVEDHQHRIWQRRLWSTLHGKTAVIVGTGIVGAAIGELLKAFGMHTIGVTRTPRKVTGFDEVMPSDRLPEAAAEGDYLVNVLPASESNIGLFDAKVFGAMKPSAYYISAGRGQTVDEDALASALREQRIAGAGFDVFQAEPLPPESPFWQLPNVFITPHVGGYVVEYEDFVMPLVIDNMRLFLAGRQSDMQNIVPRQAL